MFYTSVWCLKDEETFRNDVPLELLGKSIKLYKSSIKFRVVVLEGYNKLSIKYLETLADFGFEVIDCNMIYHRICKLFPNIVNYYSFYEANCFIRWLVFKEIISKENLNFKQIWHLDSDIILHTSLDNIAKDTKGKTFMLQGSPCFMSISDKSWFDTFEKELLKLNNDILGYSNIANNAKSSCKTNDLKLCNVSLYRNPLGSDQDLLQYLISSEKIKQSMATEIFTSELFYVQNFLNIDYWIAYHNLSNNEKITFGKQKELIYNNKMIPFIHYQGDFTGIAFYYLFLKKLHVYWIAKYFFKYKIVNNHLEYSRLINYVKIIVSKLKVRFSRFNIINELNSNNYRLLIEYLNLLIKVGS